MPVLSIRHAVRRLRRDRSLTAVALAILALGIGVNTALFSVVNAVLVKPLPYPGAERLVVLRIFDPEFQARYPSFPVNAAHLEAWRERCVSCEDLVAINSMTTTMTGRGEAEQLDGATVSASYFAFFGITPIAGRGFLPGEDRPGADRVALISHALWLRRFGGDPSVVGGTIRLDDEAVTIAGVLPARAPLPGPQHLGDLVRLSAPIDVYRPLAISPAARRSKADLNYGVVARMREGVSADALRAELDGMEPAISAQIGDDGRKRVLVRPLQQVVTRHARRPLTILFAATVGILLIVCVNLANLLLARQAGRRRDAAVRTALGAGRGTLIADAMIESLLLALGGGACGCLLAWVLTRGIARIAPVTLPAMNGFGLDGAVLLFGLGSTLAAGIAIGLLPAVRRGDVEPGDALKANSSSATDGPRAARARGVLVGAQAAIGVALLVMTGLLVLSFARLMRADKGFETAGILTVDVALPAAVFTTADRQLGVLDEAMARLRGLPGVSAVGLTSRLPLRGESTVNVLSYTDDQRPMSARPLANYRYVTPGYFSAIGTPLLRGRTFRETDRGRQVVVLSASAAEALWPGEDPIGRQVMTGGYLGAVSEVIGIAADTRAVDLTRTNVLFTYLPYWLRGPASASMVVRATVPPASLAAAARRAIWDVHRDIAIPRTETMDAILAVAVADRRFQMSLMIAFGCAAALLAALGVYGVVSYSVARRGREMGIRVALGARPSDIYRLVVREGLQPVGVGMTAGLAASFWAGRAMSSLLFEVAPADPVVLACAAGAIVTATVLACVGPARRAAAGPVGLR